MKTTIFFVVGIGMLVIGHYYPENSLNALILSNIWIVGGILSLKS